MTLRVATDSTADLDANECRSLGIVVVPLTIFFGQEALLDGLEIGPEQFYTRLRAAKVLPRTSQPSVGRFQEAFTGLAGEGATEILSLHLSAKLSGTCNAARLAAQDAPVGCTVEAFDSATVAGGLGFMARTAAQIGRDGGSLADALQAVTTLQQRHQISILLDTLEYLQRGGRIGRAQAWLGGLLNIKPIIAVEEGEVGPGERVRSRARGLERIYQRVLAHADSSHVIVQHTGAAAEAAALAERVRGALPAATVEVRWIGPVVGVYTGPNGVGAVTVQSPTP